MAPASVQLSALLAVGTAALTPLGSLISSHSASLELGHSPGTDPASVSSADKPSGCVRSVGGALHMDYRLEWEREVTSVCPNYSLSYSEE